MRRLKAALATWVCSSAPGFTSYTKMDTALPVAWWRTQQPERHGLGDHCNLPGLHQLRVRLQSSEGTPAGLAPGQLFRSWPGSRDPRPVRLSVPRSFRPPRRHCPPRSQARCREPRWPRQARRDAAVPAYRLGKAEVGRGLRSSAVPHLFTAAVQDPRPGRAALGGLRTQLEREVPDRVPGKEPHRRRRGGLGSLHSGSSGRPSRGGAGRGRDHFGLWACSCVGASLGRGLCGAEAGLKAGLSDKAERARKCWAQSPKQPSTSASLWLVTCTLQTCGRV